MTPNDSPPATEHDRPALVAPRAELLNVVDAARWLGVSRSSLYRALATHRIPVTPVILGGHIRLARRQLERWLEGQDQPGPPPTVACASSPSRVGSSGAATYDEVFRSLGPVGERRRSPTTSAASRSTSTSACA